MTSSRAAEAEINRLKAQAKWLPPPPPRFDLKAPEPTFFVENGLRKVVPFWIAYNSHVKKRWIGMTVIQLYTDWMRYLHKPGQTLLEDISRGDVILNNAPTTPDIVLKEGDIVSNLVHHHEAPVVAGRIKILYDGRHPENDGVTLVVVKPASIPTHPTGGYHFNTLTELLKHTESLPSIHIINRLDRLTSGLMVCALNTKRARELSRYFDKEGGMEKEYVARCLGEFPEQEVVVDEPIRLMESAISKYETHEDGKESKTMFRRLSYDAKTNTSIVQCLPITGRTHQIRVHLLHLSHPIANDPVYLPPSAAPLFPVPIPRAPLTAPLTGEVCGECGKPKRVDPTHDQLCIFLHALRYRLGDMEWKCEMPEWASESWQGPTSV